jgi:HEAT repeat protein
LKEPCTPVSALIEQLKDPSEAVRNAAMDNLIRIESPDLVPKVLFAIDHFIEKMEQNRNSNKALAMTYANANYAAQELLEKKGLAIVSQLLEYLSNQQVGNLALERLKSIASNNGLHFIPILSKLLASNDREIKLAALRLVRTIGKDAKVLKDLMIKLISDADHEVAWEAVYALSELQDVELEPVYRQLLNRLNEPNAVLKMAALQGLQKLGPRAVPSLAKIIECLGDESLAEQAAEVLIRIGEPARVAIPYLVMALKYDFLNHISDALLAFNPDSIWPVVEKLETTDENLKRGVQGMIRDFAYKAGPGPMVNMLPFLVNKLKTNDELTLKLAVRALGVVGEAAEEVVPLLTELAQTGFPAVRSEANIAIKKIYDDVKRSEEIR